MAQSSTRTVELLDSIRVSPPPGSVPTTTLPLVYFDLAWFNAAHIKRLYFYEFPHPTSFFMETTLPMLTRSLSLTLQRFFPYAANIMCPQQPGKPYIYYTEGDFINFVVAESTTADFNHVKANYPRPVQVLHPFVPQLPPARHLTEEDGNNTRRVLPVLSFQVTVFPNSGICIGSTYCHVVGDGSSFMHFMRSWTSVCRSGGDLTFIENSPPLINRDLIKDPAGLESVELKGYWKWVSSFSNDSGPTHDVDKVRATFVLNRADAERLKDLVKAGVDTKELHISTFVVTCALVWVCLIKSKEISSGDDAHDDDDVFYSFLFAFDCRNRLEFPVPTAYFGNCLKPSLVDVKKSELIGDNGIVLAAKAIGNEIKEVGRSALRGGEKGPSIVERVKSGRLTSVAGSPKFHDYGTDFGWGRPCKVELTHIDGGGAISLADCGGDYGIGQGGGIEVGLALHNFQMDAFITIFEQSLKKLL